VPFQIQLIINAGGIMVPSLVLAVLIGPRAVGYLSWAQNYGSKPLDVVQNVMRVGFSHFSRIQDDRARVEQTIVRYLTFLLPLSGCWFACTATAGPDLVHLVFTQTWAPAVPALILFAAALNCSVLSSVGAVTLNSLGLVRYATRVMVVRTMAHVALSVLLAMRFGFTGVAIAWCMAALLEGQLIYTGLDRGAWRRVLGSVAWVALPVLVGVVLGSVVARLPLPLRPRACLTLILTFLAYWTAAWPASPRWLRELLLQRAGANVPGHWRGAVVLPEVEGV
jgi:O-antigen/teichoic acid export membrane protein